LLRRPAIANAAFSMTRSGIAPASSAMRAGTAPFLTILEASASTPALGDSVSNGDGGFLDDPLDDLGFRRFDARCGF
jgi:hypothetical protein